MGPVVIGILFLRRASSAAPREERDRMQEWNMAIAVPLSGSQQTPAVDTDATGSRPSGR